MRGRSRQTQMNALDEDVDAPVAPGCAKTSRSCVVSLRRQSTTITDSQLLVAGLGAAAAVWSAGFAPNKLGAALAALPCVVVAAGVDAPWPAGFAPKAPPPKRLFPEAPPAALPPAEGAEPKRPPPPNVFGTALPNKPPDGAEVVAAGVVVVFPKRPLPAAGVDDAPWLVVLVPRAPNKPLPSPVLAVLAVFPKRPAPGVVVVVLPPMFPNSPPPLPAAGVAAFPPVLPNRPPPEGCPAVLVAPSNPLPVAGLAALFPNRPVPEPIDRV